MKPRLRQMWEAFVAAYWAGARRRFERESLPWVEPLVKQLRAAQTSNRITRGIEVRKHKAEVTAMAATQLVNVP